MTTQTLRIGKSLSGHVTHYAHPTREGASLCGAVQGTLRIEPSSTTVGCARCRARRS